MTAYEQRSYTGNAADTLLNADLAAGGLSFSVTPGTGGGYPDGSQGPFHVFIDYDNSKIEKVRCSGRVNDTFTVAGSGGGRGQDGTTAQAHTANARVRHGWTATDAQEANRAAASTVGLITTKGDLLAGSGANALARIAAGANGTIPIFDSTQPSGVRAGANPSLTGPSIAAPALSGQPTSPFTGPTFTNVAVFTNSWVAGADAPGYAIDATGFVVLRGNMTSGVIGTTAFTLPVGYRPLVNKAFAVYSDNGVGTVIVAGVTITTVGAVFVSGGHNAYLGLNNIRFKAEQ